MPPCPLALKIPTISTSVIRSKSLLGPIFGIERRIRTIKASSWRQSQRYFHIYGTPSLPSLDGAVLLLEDLDEYHYQWIACYCRSSVKVHLME